MRTIATLLALSALQISPVLVQAEDGWDYRLTAYGWFAGLKGDVASIPGGPTVPIDVSASDAFSDTEASAMFIVDAKHDQDGIFFDFVYSDVRSDEELIPSPINLTLKTITKTTIASIAYERELYSQDKAVVDLLAGARYWNIDSELKFGGGKGLLAGKSVSNTEWWIDPFIGVKGRMPLGDSQFYLAGGAGIGGFGISSDLFYELNGALGYQWNDAIGTAIGYRMFDVDYEDDGYVYDVRQQGWQLGLTWAF